VFGGNRRRDNIQRRLGPPMADAIRGQRSKQQLIDRSKDRGVRPNADGEREHGHGGEAGVFQQLAEGEFKVVHERWMMVAAGCEAQPMVRTPDQGALADAPDTR
jgi:hypothetical protein